MATETARVDAPAKKAKTFTPDIESYIKFCDEVFGEYPSLRLIAESKTIVDYLTSKAKEDEKEPNFIRKYTFRGTDTDAYTSLIEEEVVKRNNAGFAVYYLPNRFKKSAKQETYKNIEAFRAFVLDLDYAPLAPVIEWAETEGFAPTAVVNTSPDKYQVIWRIEDIYLAANEPSSDETHITPDRYNNLIAALANRFGGDLNTCKATQVFRAPGFIHSKKEDGLFLSCIERLNPEAVYSFFDFEKAVAALDPEGSFMEDGRPARPKKPRKVDLNRVKAAMANVTGGERHDTARDLAFTYYEQELTDAEVEKAIYQDIKNTFTEPERFLPGGDRHHETLRSIQYAKEKQSENKIKRIKQTAAARAKRQEAKEKRTKAAATDITETIESTRRDVIKDEGSLFTYDYSSGALKDYRFSETAIAERVLQKFGKEILATVNGFYAFMPRQKVWQMQSSETSYGLQDKVISCIKDTILDDKFESTICVDSHGKPSSTAKDRFLKSVYSSHTVSAVVKIIRAFLASNEKSPFDKNRTVIFCRNGLVDMLTMTLRDPRAEDFLLARSDATFDPKYLDPALNDARISGWLNFLSEVFPEDPELIPFMQELFGYSISGLIGEQKIFCHEGYGANGKSKLLSALTAILRSAYGYETIIEHSDLVKGGNKFNDVALERVAAKVEGKRFVLIDDMATKGEVTINEAFVKQLTGERIRARAEYERSREVLNVAKFHLGTNKRPAPEAENYGIIRRFCFIPYKVEFTVSVKKGQEIDDMIARELDGIFMWALQGFTRMYERGGLDYPEVTQAALEEYRKEHFIVETAVKELLCPPEESEDLPRSEWVRFGKVTEDVLDYVRALNPRCEEPTNKEIAAAINRFHYPKARFRIKGVYDLNLQVKYRISETELKKRTRSKLDG